MNSSSLSVSPHKAELGVTERTDAGPLDDEEDDGDGSVKDLGLPGGQDAPDRGGAEDEDGVQGAADQHDEVKAGDAPRRLPFPGQPSLAERLAHETTHWPYRPWCEWCVRGRAVGPNSKTIPVGYRETAIPTAHMDNAFLQDEVVEGDTEYDECGSANLNMCILVMLETLCHSVWVYATNGKGYASDPWLPKKLHNDLLTVGMGNVRIIVKCDTEASIIDMRKEMIKCR